jgi:hypothetical protein
MIDFRERLELMGKCPKLCALSKEGFVLQVMTLLSLLEIECQGLMRVGASPSLPPTVVPALNEEAIDDAWAQEVVDRALKMLPPGPHKYNLAAAPEEKAAEN